MDTMGLSVFSTSFGVSSMNITQSDDIVTTITIANDAMDAFSISPKNIMAMNTITDIADSMININMVTEMSHPNMGHMMMLSMNIPAQPERCIGPFLSYPTVMYRASMSDDANNRR